MQPIKYPMRQIQFTFTHETLGDLRFAPMVVEAFAERQAFLAAQPHELSKHFAEQFKAGTAVSDLDDFRASNGVLIQVRVPPDVDDMPVPIEAPDFGAQLSYKYELGYSRGIKDVLSGLRNFAQMTVSEREALTAVPPYQGQEDG